MRQAFWLAIAVVASLSAAYLLYTLARDGAWSYVAATFVALPVIFYIVNKRYRWI